MLTITEAAKRAGISRAAIHKAIKAGRLSWTKDDKEHFLIDPSELDRVYQPVDKENTDSINPTEYQLLAQKLDFTERLLWQTENERDRLAQVITMLSHQPVTQPAEPRRDSSHTGKKEDSLLWKRLFNRHAC